jgi:hypothetical protein
MSQITEIFEQKYSWVPPAHDPFHIQHPRSNCPPLGIWQLCKELQYSSTYTDAAYPDRLAPAGKFVVNSTRISYLVITSCRIEYQCSVVASRTLNQAWSKGLGAGEGKEVTLQAWSGPEGCRKLRSPDFLTMAQDGGKVVSFTHRPHLPPGNTPDTHFC